MTRLLSYLSFNGNCKEAFTFYQQCFGGQITIMQTYGESPLDIPEDKKDFIFNAELTVADLFILKGSDTLPPYPYIAGTNFSLFVVYKNRDTIEKNFNQLIENGNVMMPLEANPNGNMFGMLKDQFGLQWMLVLE